MYKGKHVGVVVPAYNEEGFVGDVIETIPGFVDRVYVVDDASTDGTWAEIRHTAERVNSSARTDHGEPDAVLASDAGEGSSDEHGESGSVLSGNGVTVSGESDDGDDGRRVVTIQHDENRGVGGAIKTGYLRARDDGVDAVAVMGGDGQMDPAHLDRVLDPVVEERADYAKANRLVERDLGGMPRFRLVGNAILTALTKIATGYWGVGDPQNGYTAISRRALEAVEVEEMYEFYGYCNDLLAKLNVHGMRVADVPAPGRYRDEESHIDYTTYVPKVSAMLLHNFLWRLTERYVVRGFHPLAACYALGMLGGVAGVLQAARAVARDDGDRGGCAVTTLLVSGLLFAAGMALDLDDNQELCMDGERE